MIDREERNTPSDAASASAAAVISSSNDTAKGEAGSPVGLPYNSPDTAEHGRLETVTQSPRKAVDELVGPEKGSAEAGGSGQPELIPALTGAASRRKRQRPETAGVTDRRDDHLVPEPDGGAISEVKGKARLENADGVEPPPSVTIPKPAPSMDELRIANALILRPNCKRPGRETCGGQGRNHCRDCMAAPAEREREEA